MEVALMKSRIKSILFTLGLAVASGAAQAHHGASVVYDLAEHLTMTGTVTDFQFVNPHVLIFFEVEGADGTKTVWSAGLTSPNRLARSDGWSKAMFKPGDTVTITGSPARSGAPSLWVEGVLDGQGKSLLGGPGE
jgi:hypothetical protein